MIESHKCPDRLPSELTGILEAFGQKWASSPIRPRPSLDTLKKWQDLLLEWSSCDDMPLYIRKTSYVRGQSIHHSQGRILIPVDNSPAQWVYMLALKNEVPSLRGIQNYIANDKIPVAMILKASEKSIADHKCVLSNESNTNKIGWKLAHITNIGLNSRKSIESINMETLKSHFIDFFSPSNMFLVPIAWAGIAEIDSIINAVKKYDHANPVA